MQSTLITRVNVFRRDAAAAVTVDWVVMTAAVCIISGVTVTAVHRGAVDLVEDLSTVMDANAPPP